MTKQIAMAALAVLSLVGVAAAGDLKPMHSRSIDLGTMSGIAYYTVEPEGYHVVATLTDENAVTPVRFEAVLVSGQTITLSTPREAGIAAGQGRDQPRGRQRSCRGSTGDELMRSAAVRPPPETVMARSAGAIFVRQPASGRFPGARLYADALPGTRFVERWWEPLM